MGKSRRQIRFLHRLTFWPAIASAFFLSPLRPKWGRFSFPFPFASIFQAHSLKIIKNVAFLNVGIFHQFWLIFVHSKCKLSSLPSQCWMRLFLWFSNTVFQVAHAQQCSCTQGKLSTQRNEIEDKMGVKKKMNTIRWQPCQKKLKRGKNCKNHLFPHPCWSWSFPLLAF